jgi:hypothetical protein
MLLAEPTLHWKREASAMELAVSWELAAKTDSGLPQQVAEVLDRHASTAGAQLLFAIPEHRVALPGGSRPSQTDLWAVLKVSGGWASVAVEGKAGEPFGSSINEWLREPSPGKTTRLDALRRTLGLGTAPLPHLRYQLFHRSASAALEAVRIGANTAVVLVQNFRADTTCWADFEAFVSQFGVSATRGGVCEATCPGVERLLFAWVDCPTASDAELARAVEGAGAAAPPRSRFERGEGRCEGK